MPTQPAPMSGEIHWQEIRVQGSESLAVRAGKKLRNEELLFVEFSGTRLRMELDRIPLWRGDDVTVRQLIEDFAQYPYLPRLRDSELLRSAVQQGASRLTWESDGFAYAEAWDANQQRYLGLQAGTATNVMLDAQSLVVRPDVARRQLEADRQQREQQEQERQRRGTDVYVSAGEHAGGNGEVRDGHTSTGEVSGGTTVAPRAPVYTRFHGSIDLDAERLIAGADQLAREVVQHLGTPPGARVRVTVEIEAEFPEGAPAHLVRTVTENARVLKFRSAGFEES